MNAISSVWPPANAMRLSISVLCCTVALAACAGWFGEEPAFGIGEPVKVGENEVWIYRSSASDDRSEICVDQVLDQDFGGCATYRIGGEFNVTAVLKGDLVIVVGSAHEGETILVENEAAWLAPDPKHRSINLFSFEVRQPGGEQIESVFVERTKGDTSERYDIQVLELG